jgi:hypothetical protein
MLPAPSERPMHHAANSWCRLEAQCPLSGAKRTFRTSMGLTIEQTAEYRGSTPLNQLSVVRSQRSTACARRM